MSPDALVGDLPGVAHPARRWVTPLDRRRADTAFFETHWHHIIRGSTPAVAEYLHAERQLTGKTLDDDGYHGLIEVGCADGSLLMPGAIDRGLDYLGVDLAAGAVALARRALAATSHAGRQRRTAVIEGDVRDLPTLAGRLPAAPRLVAFPFNVLAGIPTPRDALRAADSCGGDILVLTYQTTPAATEVRRDYYRACGFQGRFRRDRDGVHFTADLFTSSVYHRDVIVGWLEELGYRVEVEPFAAVGLAYHARRRTP
ncbi:MAG TPA: hypothetical protein VF755_14855 [Catenuloplanes sp.]